MKAAITNQRFVISVQGWRFVSIDPLTDELCHVEDRGMATRFGEMEARSVLARWIEGERRLGWHVPGQAKMLSAATLQPLQEPKLYHTAKLQLNDFTVPPIPDSYRLIAVDVMDATKNYPSREKTFDGDTGAIDLACEYALLYVGWERSEIVLILAGDGLPESRMIYTPRTDNWDYETDVADDDPEAAQIGVMPTEPSADDTPTRAESPLLALAVEDGDVLEVVG